MSVAEAQTEGAIRAKLNYIVDTGKPPVSIIDWPEMEHAANPPQYESKETTIHNGRPLKDTFSLDVHGFVFAEHPTKVTDFTDERQRKEIYDPEIQALIKKYSGASDVLVFDHTIRVGDEATRDSLKARAPVRGVHNDYTERSAPQRLRDILGDAEAEERMKKRFAIIQVWRAINKPIQANPLAVADATTIDTNDLMVAERRYPHRVGQTYRLKYNPKHRWVYFPEMRRDEALVFKVYDSEKDGRARFTPHTSFDDPASPPNAAPRQSIEVRALAFFAPR